MNKAEQLAAVKTVLDQYAAIVGLIDQRRAILDELLSEIETCQREARRVLKGLAAAVEDDSGADWWKRSMK